MADFAALAATTKRLIDGNGISVTVRRLGNSPTDDFEKPWRSDTRPVVAEVVGSGVWVTDNVRQGISLSLARSKDNSEADDVAVMLFAAANDGGNELEGFDEIEVASVVWRIVRTELLQPASDRLLYVFEVIR